MVRHPAILPAHLRGRRVWMRTKRRSRYEVAKSTFVQNMLLPPEGLSLAPMRFSGLATLKDIPLSEEQKAAAALAMLNYRREQYLLTQEYAEAVRTMLRRLISLWATGPAALGTY